MVGSISVRRIEEETLEALRVRAASRGVSMEEEVRRILRQAVREPVWLGDLALEMFGPANGVDLPVRERRPHEPIDFDE
jgi:plasmid stability protein